MEKLRVDTEALAAAGGTLGQVAGNFVTDGSDNAGSLGAEAIGHPGLTFAVSDFCEQARRVATDLAGGVESLGATARSGSLAYEQTEGANESFFWSMLRG